MAKAKRIFGLLLRLIAFGSTLAATIVMATSHESASLFNTISFEVKYSDTPACKYFVIVNAIASVYDFLVLFLPSESLLWRFVVAADLVFTMLLTSSISAALAIAHVGKKGNTLAGWLPICGRVHKYCDQITAALALGFISLIISAIHLVLYPLLLQIT